MVFPLQFFFSPYWACLILSKCRTYILSSLIYYNFYRWLFGWMWIANFKARPWNLACITKYFWSTKFQNTTFLFYVSRKDFAQKFIFQLFLFVSLFGSCLIMSFWLVWIFSTALKFVSRELMMTIVFVFEVFG